MPLHVLLLQQLRGERLKDQKVTTLQMMRKQMRDDCEVWHCDEWFCNVICAIMQCLSVRLSVTYRYCVESAEPRVFTTGLPKDSWFPSV